MKKQTNYVLITAARNEEAYIEKTIQSVINQTFLPEKWVIVSDGSIDGTDDIIKRFRKNYDFIQLLHRHPGGTRNFASKAYAVRAGVKMLNDSEYDFIGNLDADVSFESNYYARVLEKFQHNPKLGIVGGMVFEESNGKWIPQIISPSCSVAGAIQMFRRKCFETIAGYMPHEKGGIDAIAEVKARMHGWEIKSFPDLKVMHHRRTGTQKAHILTARFHQGIMEHFHGNHPLFEMAKCLFRIREKPYVFGSLFRLTGYCYAFFRRNQRDVPHEVVKFLRREQMNRLFTLLSKKKKK